MSATLTWYNSGLGTKTGTTVGTLFTDFKTLFDSKAADSNFKWEVAASSLAGTPYYLWLRRKDGSNGRILMICWTSAPAGNNAAILDSTPTTNNVFLAYFPNGTAASPSNLTASSGTISGDDTNCVKCSCFGAISTIYSASTQPFYFENEEGIFFCCCNPATSTNYGGGAGELVVDANDVAYGATIGINGGAWSSFSSPTSSLLYATTGVAAGATTGVGIKSNYSSQTLVGSIYPTWYAAWAPSGPWGTTTIGVNDILTDTTNTDAWFVAMPLMVCGVKGGGFPLKLRQIAIGPQSLGQFSVYNTTGPVTSARCMAASTGATTGHPWFTNFKI